MTLTQEAISKAFELMYERSGGFGAEPVQLNSIDLLILGKTDREVAEIIGVRRKTITNWTKDPFSAQNGASEEDMWVDITAAIQFSRQGPVLRLIDKEPYEGAESGELGRKDFTAKLSKAFI